MNKKIGHLKLYRIAKSKKKKVKIDYRTYEIALNT